MGINFTEQLKRILSESKNVLILLPQNPDGDAIGSGWSFYFFLKEKGIDVTLAVDDPQNNKSKFSFLPRPEKLEANVLCSREFILSFNTAFNKITNVRTEKLENETRIYITPEHGSIDPRDFSFIPAKFKYDLAICLSAPDKESFGKIFEENPDIFYEIPIVNIDNHNNNDNFGQINIVDITASSTSEMLFSILEEVGGRPINKDIAKCLLTGVISATNSFQNNKTTPKSLQLSSQLMQMGADQQEIIRHLYKTHPFSVLKLWGIVMSKLKWNEELKLVWSLISVEDFVQSRSEPKDIPFILDRIQSSYESGKNFMVLYNKSATSIKGVAKFSNPEAFRNNPNFENGKITGNLIEFEINNATIHEAETKILEEIKNKLN